MNEGGQRHSRPFSVSGDGNQQPLFRREEGEMEGKQNRMRISAFHRPLAGKGECAEDFGSISKTNEFVSLYGAWLLQLSECPDFSGCRVALLSNPPPFVQPVF